MSAERIETIQLREHKSRKCIRGDHFGCYGYWTVYPGGESNEGECECDCHNEALEVGR